MGRLSISSMQRTFAIVATAVVTFGAGVGGAAQAAAASPPTSAVDSTKVPHYFGPWPNWALSPLTTNNAVVTIVGDGTGAEATANVDPMTGAVAGLDITKPGKNYTTASVQISGGNADASATATISASAGVTAYAVTDGGHGYDTFSVTVSGGGGTGATALASGGVDAVNIIDGGAGFTMPTVEFSLPDLDGGSVATGHVATVTADGVDGMTPSGTITQIVVDNAGTGYTKAPEVTVHNGTLYDPIAGSDPITATTTLKVNALKVVDQGAGYTGAPTVVVTDPTGTGSGAVIAPEVNTGSIDKLTLVAGGSGFLTKGIKKFQDQLPVACDPATAPSAGGCPEHDPTAKFIPVGVPEAKTYSGQEADQYVIGLVQYRTQFNTDLSEGTLARGYVQIETPANAAISEHYPLTNELLDRTTVPVLDANGDQVYGVTSPQWLGPFIQATKDRAVRIIFHNYLPTGVNGDLFLPTDTTMMGSGMGPMAMDAPVNSGQVTDEVRNPACTNAKSLMCFTDNRATLHLHGGTTPWISDGTPHQWITPANETTDLPQGVSVRNVPDMADAGCEAADDGCQTFYYTNQQSARLMFYHDHSWGITRLNVYAGEAAGYSITDDTEKALVASGTIPDAASTIPLIVQDRTFTPSAKQLAEQDPTWDAARWGTKGSFWYHHVYMPAQNPGDPGGMSAYGRWMYGPWFWPPATGTKYGPIDNPYYDPNCHLDDPTTWTYQTDPFCEPQQIPGTPNISAGMEQFNDTPVVNGVAYPTTTLQPKTYRFRMLNAANDRFFNFQWYVADPKQGNGETEVELNPIELKAAQTDPNISPTPAHALDNAAGPDWVQIASEGGWLPQPAVIDGQQPTTWITDPTRFDVGNVDKHSMLLAPAERSDAIVDFSQFAGKTLILYNDAPAAFPARVSTYDYYTGAPDLSPNGAPGVLPGYGPNTRTIMQVKIAPATPAAPFDLAKLTNAFKHTINGTGVFEKAQHPIIVGQAAYNTTYGASFSAGSNCSVGTAQRCDGLVRINDTATFNFNTLRSQNTRVSMPLQPKAIHDEMNATTFDEFGRMQANLGVEASPPTPGAQNVTLYPFVNPATELIDGTNLPTTATKVTPISSMADGTQIWRITHNGVDTHPIHFHLYDVQLINRVTWDNIIIPPDPNELGWKDTVRVSPLEDTIVALRPVIPVLPFEIPNSIRPLDPMMPLGSTASFNNVDVNGNPTTAITNQLSNFGWEYVFHCHILSHEEMDMMRPVLLALPPRKPDRLSKTLDSNGVLSVNWWDNSITETSQVLQRSVDGTTWTDVGAIQSPLGDRNGHEARAMVDPLGATTAYQYRIVAKNTVGYGGQFPGMTVQSVSTILNGDLPAAPSALTAAQTAPQTTSVTLAWTDNANNETGYAVDRSTDGGATWVNVTSALPADSASYVDPTVQRGITYTYRVAATNATGQAFSNTASILLVSAPTNVAVAGTGTSQATVTFTDTATNETGFVVGRSTDGVTWTTVTASPLPALAGTGAVGTFVDPTPPTGVALQYRAGATKGLDIAWSTSVGITILAAPTNLTATATPDGQPTAVLTWVDHTGGTAPQTVQRSTDGGATWVDVATPAAGVTTWTDPNAAFGSTYTYQVGVAGSAGMAWSAPASVLMLAAPGAPTLTSLGTGIQVTWTDASTNETGFVVERSADGGTSWTTLSTSPALAGSGTNGDYIDATATAGSTWTYRVGAVNGTIVRYSPAVSLALVAAPSNLNAAAANGPAVSLTWANPAGSSATSLVVQRTADSGATWADVATLPATDTAYTDTTVTTNTTYGYRVVAHDAVSSAASNVATVILVSPPTGVTLTSTQPTATTFAVTVGWVDTATAESGYVVERSSDGGVTWTTLGTTLPAIAGAGSTGTYVDPTATEGTLTYRVGAVNGLQVAYSGPVSITLVAAPTGLALAGGVNGSVILTWTDNATTETSYLVERSTDGGTTWNTTATLAANTVTWTDAATVRGTTYTYRVSAVVGAASAASGTASMRVITAPTGLSAVVNAGPVAVVSWADQVGETGYVLQQSTNGGTTWSTVGATLGANVTSALTSTLTVGTAYLFRVQALNGADVVTSASIAVTPMAAPTNLTLSAVAPSAVRLRWTDRANNETGYRIERSSTSGATWSVVNTLPASAGTGTTMSWTDYTTSLGVTYMYRVQVYNATSAGYSNITSIFVGRPPAVTGVTGTNTVNLLFWSDVAVGWSPSVGATTYTVQRATSATGTGTVSVSVNAPTTNYTWSNLSAVNYWVRVRANNGYGSSAWSAWVALPLR